MIPAHDVPEEFTKGVLIDSWRRWSLLTLTSARMYRNLSLVTRKLGSRSIVLQPQSCIAFPRSCRRLGEKMLKLDRVHPGLMC